MTTLRIAVLVDTATGWGRRIIRGVLDYAKEHGPFDIQIEAKGRSDLIEIPSDLDVDGVIARVATELMAKQLKQLKQPVVNVSSLLFKDGDFPRVAVGWDESAHLAEQHFRDRGINHFAYIGPVQMDYVQDHERSFEKALAASGTPCHVYQPKVASNPQGTWHPEKRDLVPWLTALPKPVGIFTWGCDVGRTVINACRDASLSVPHDVAVLGGDYDELLSDASHPALSGIVTPAVQAGYRATAILHSMMLGEPPLTELTFIAPKRIEERLSTDTLATQDPQLLQAVQFVRDHAFEPIHVDDILRRVPMARRALERKFTQLLGRGPAQEIRRVRLNHARALLGNSDLSMQRIAEACGFTSYGYLGTVFKKETGITPGQYRTQVRKGDPDISHGLSGQHDASFE